MKNNSAHLCIDRLPSIDLRGPVGPDYAKESVNYRPLPDGSLQKRCGYARRLLLPEAPSCIASVCRNGERRIMAVVGQSICSLELESGNCTALDGTLPNAPDDSTLFNFRDRLLILDGSALRRVDDDVITRPQGYAPLYGRNWHPKNGGEVYEPRNLLNKELRIHFIGEASQELLHLPHDTVSVARVEIDGEALLTQNYSFNSTNQTLYSSYFGYDGIDIVVWLTLSELLPERDLLNACLMAEVVGSGEDSVIFCSKCAASPHTIFRSAPVRLESLHASRRGFAESDELYFPENGRFSVGSDDLPVTALLALDDRVIVYNSDEAWLVPSVSSRPEATVLCREVGCSSSGAAVICGELPAGLCRGSVYAWEPDLEAYSELIAVRVSEPIESLMTDGLATRGRLISDRDRHELWLYDPFGDAGSPILIYDRDGRRWYTFSGPIIEKALFHDGRIVFSSGRAVYTFDESRSTDSENGTTDSAIGSRFGSAWLDFDDQTALKLARYLTVKLCGSVSLTIEYDRERSQTLNFSAPSTPKVIRKRLRKARFRQLRITFSDSSTTSGRVFELTLDADILQKKL